MSTTPALDDLAELMRYAWAMESEASERYEEMADAMDTHNNAEVAGLFRKMSRIEALHADQILRAMNWSEPPASPPGGFRWGADEGPETGEHTDLHYLMHPRHALDIALRNEQRAQRFYHALMTATADPAIRQAAEEFESEEREHVRLIEEWIARTPAPPSHWRHDDDPPSVVD